MKFKSQFTQSVGIDDISIYIPSLFIDIRDFAKARNIDPLKLEKGLGLKSFAIPDASEDVITMAAEAMIDLVKKNDLKPQDIGRIYVGTESMVDGSKPNASYLLGVLKRYFEQASASTEYLNRCDVVDMTFACIGAVDAMQNSIDWIRLNPDAKAIVIATDWAKYDLNSPGECTQGAGAVAVLISSAPRIMEIGTNWGVSSQCEHDFFKPLRRKVRYEDIVASNGVDKSLLGRGVDVYHKDTPIYDGHFSNECYTARIQEAFDHFKSNNQNTRDFLQDWEELVFHLPYAFHARRVFTSLFIDNLKESGKWKIFASAFDKNISAEDPNYDKLLVKAVSKTNEYRTFVEEKIKAGEKASSLVGNMYTGSIFLSLLSTLSYNPQKDLSNKILGFFAYGSGSKSKVFEARIVPGYQKLIQDINIFQRLSERKPVSIDHYEYLHKGTLLFNLDSEKRNVFQISSGWTETNKYAREYSFINKPT